MYRPPKARCKRGHPLTPGHANVYVAPSGERQCRECARQRKRKVNKKLKAARRKASTLRRCIICYRRLPPGLRADARICGRLECVRAQHSAHWRARNGKGRGPYRT